MPVNRGPAGASAAGGSAAGGSAAAAVVVLCFLKDAELQMVEHVLGVWVKHMTSIRPTMYHAYVYVRALRLREVSTIILLTVRTIARTTVVAA